MSREFLLAAACSIWPHSEHRAAAIRAAVASPLDWVRFLRVVKRHRVAGLVHDGLKRVGLSVPREIAQAIGSEAAALARQNLTLAADAVKLQRLFAEAGISVLFLKGAPLAMVAYGNLALRHSRDIDLLVSPDALLESAALMQRAGYVRSTPPQSATAAQLNILHSLLKDLVYIEPVSNFDVELHLRLFSNPHLLAHLPMEAPRMISLSGRCEVPTLGDEDMFAYLCVHGAIHSWFRLKWLADIGALIAPASAEDIVRLYRAAEARGAGRAAAQALLLCHRLLGSRVPDPLVATLRQSATVRWLEVTGLKAMTRGDGEVEPAQVWFGTTPTRVAGFLLGRGWRYWLAELQITSPTDVLTIPLPRRLQFLYPMLRLPLWLWRRFVRLGH